MQEQSSSNVYCFIISCFLAAGSREPGAQLFGGREPGTGGPIVLAAGSRVPGALLLGGRRLGTGGRYWLKARVAAMQTTTPMSHGHLTFSPRIIAIAHTIAP